MGCAISKYGEMGTSSLNLTYHTGMGVVVRFFSISNLDSWGSCETFFKNIKSSETDPFHVWQGPSMRSNWTIKKFQMWKMPKDCFRSLQNRCIHLWKQGKAGKLLQFSIYKWFMVFQCTLQIQSVAKQVVLSTKQFRSNLRNSLVGIFFYTRHHGISLRQEIFKYRGNNSNLDILVLGSWFWKIVLEQKGIQTPKGYWGISEQIKHLQLVGQEAEFKLKSSFEPLPVSGNHYRKLFHIESTIVPEENPRFGLENQWQSSWGCAPAELGQVWRPSTQTQAVS